MSLTNIQAFTRLGKNMQARAHFSPIIITYILKLSLFYVSILHKTRTSSPPWRRLQREKKKKNRPGVVRDVGQGDPAGVLNSPARRPGPGALFGRLGGKVLL